MSSIMTSIPAVRSKRTFASDDKRRLAYNAYMREYNARRREATAQGIEVEHKYEKLPIDADRVHNKSGYMREYAVLRAERRRERQREQYKNRVVDVVDTQ